MAPTLKNPPAGLIQTPESYFRRKQRELSFYFITTFRLHLIHFGGCLLIIVFFMLMMVTPLMERFENVFVDVFFRQRPPIAMHPAIVHVDMAEDSLQAFGRWPWPRHNHAAMVHILKEWGAKAIVFDAIFSEPSTTFDDESFAQAIREAGNVYMPVMLESTGRGGKGWVHSMPELEKPAKGIGHINIFPDRDGTIRRVVPVAGYNGESFAYLGAKVAFDYLGKPLSKEKLGIPTDSQGRIFINWVGRWKDSFQHYSFRDLIKSFADIREGKVPLITPDKIQGKICVIGLTAMGLTDIKANPMEEAYPAVGVQTNIMNGILTGQYIRPAPKSWNLLVLALLGLFGSIFFFFSRGTLSFIVGLVLGVAWVAVAYWIFLKMGIWVFVMNPLLLIFSLFVFTAVFSLTIGKKEQERLFNLATRDGLPGLYVIRHFRTLLNQAALEAGRKGTPLSLLIFDLDHFKNINDRYGHMAGDVALKRVAQIMQKASRDEGEKTEKNIVGRYGGEEFMVMLKQRTLIEAAFNYAERIRKAVEEEVIEYEGVKIPVTISAGAATLHSGETVPDLMVHRADEALYRAKAGGRNRTCVESEEGKEPSRKEE
jgi:diguanylate cyclase (GGDEF)-like protein